MTIQLAVPESQPLQWTRRHLLGLEELSRAEIETILDTAEHFVEVSQRRRKKRADLKGKVVVNLFFEPSTRTRTSFALAAKRLSADTLDFTAGGSSLSKGETFIDTAKNIEAMGIDVVVVRHSVRRRAAPAGPASRTAASSTPATAPTSTRRRACSTSSPFAGFKGRRRGPDGRPGRRHRP